MPCRVLLTADAVADLDELYDYIATHDSPAKAEHVLGRIEQLLDSLSEMPERGAVPKELQAIGVHDYREVWFKPYRLVYRPIDDVMYVYLIADGHRDLQALLLRRLLAG